MEDFIKLRQGGMSILDYFLKFTKLSKYAQSLVSNPRYEMSRFLIGVSKNMVKECRSAMLHENWSYLFRKHFSKWSQPFGNVTTLQESQNPSFDVHTYRTQHILLSYY